MTNATQGATQGAMAGSSFGPGGAGIGLGLGLLGGMFGKQGGTFYENPYQMNNRFSTLNPWLYGAMTGKWSNGATPSSGLGAQFSQMANNPGYIDPRVMNMPYAQVEQNANTNMQRMSDMLGRNNMSGGMANMYAMANLAGRGAARGQIAQNYVMQREQQRRADLANMMSWMYGAQGLQGPAYYQPPDMMAKLGNFGQGLGWMSGYLNNNRRG